MQLTQPTLRLPLLQRLAATCAAFVLASGVCASAFALHLSLASPPAAREPKDSGSARVSGGVMAGQLLTKVNPVYPPDAKAAGVQGAVVLSVVIGKDGTVQKLSVLSGPEPLQAPSVEAVRQWVYKPYLLNGMPTEVSTTITVTYSLAH